MRRQYFKLVGRPTLLKGYVYDRVPLRDQNGNITKWYSVSSDIEDRKRAEHAAAASERNLKLIIDTMPAVAWSARADGSIEFFNQNYLDYVGLSLAQVQGWGWTVAVHPDDVAGLTTTWRNLMAAGAPGEAEARLRRQALHDHLAVLGAHLGVHGQVARERRGERALGWAGRVVVRLRQGNSGRQSQGRAGERQRGRGRRSHDHVLDGARREMARRFVFGSGAVARATAFGFEP